MAVYEPLSKLLASPLIVAGRGREGRRGPREVNRGTYDPRLQHRTLDPEP